MTTPEHRDDIPAADAAEQDLPADAATGDTDETPAEGPVDLPADADPADVLEQRADATPDEEEWPA
ncbi:MAG: hypothetical protein M3235_14415 [Actinomycetota bacterium]|nr:hypothetical protein [Actinomycetota bacterium]